MKALIALLVVLLVGLLGVGGYFVYEYLWLPETAAQTQLETGDTTSEARNRPQLARMRLPKNTGEVFERIQYAIEKSPDAVGWISIPDTKINNVVMQSGDNRYYLRRDEDGNSDIYGCYFMDYESTLGSREVFRPNTVIYGHSDLQDNPDGPRFSELFKFTDIAFAQSHPNIYLTSPQERFVFEIFAVFYTDTQFDYIQVNMSEAETLALASEAKSDSIYDYGITPQGTDRLLTLSTCSVENGTDGRHRFVVMGRLLGESDTEKSGIPLVAN